MSNPATQIQQQIKERNELRQWLESDKFKASVANALPEKVMRPETLVRIALTATMKTPKLLDCSKESVFQCILDLASAGLAPDGRNAHLIPYGNKCTLIIDYKGYVRLLMRSGEVSYVHAEAVCENDIFEYSMGKVTAHKIDFKNNRGKPYVYYSVVEMKDGTKSYEVMTMDEIYAIRDNSAGYKRDKINSPWANYEGEMCKKTVFRRHQKWLPVSYELQNNIDRLDSHDENVTGMKQVNPDFIDDPTDGLFDGIGEPKTEPKAEPVSKSEPAVTKTRSPRTKTVVPPPAITKEVTKPVETQEEAQAKQEAAEAVFNEIMPEKAPEPSVDEAMDNTEVTTPVVEEMTAKELHVALVEYIQTNKISEGIISHLVARGKANPGARLFRDINEEQRRWLWANRDKVRNAMRSKEEIDSIF